MNFKKLVCWCLGFVFFSAGAVAQNADSLAFPASWQGKWSGDLEIFAQRGKVQTVPMEMHVLPIDSATWTWTIIYGEDKEAGKRPYTLKILDAKRGIFAVDEHNSIVLDAYMLGGKLFEQFEVQGSLLLSMTEKVGEQLVFEIISVKTDKFNVTGGTKQGEEEIPVVKSYPITIRQKAILSKTRG